MRRTGFQRKPEPGPPCGKCDPDDGLWNLCRGCRAHFGPPKPKAAARKAIKAKTSEQRQIEAAYSRERVSFLTTHRLCEIRYDGDRQNQPCTEIATQVHHVVDRGKARWLIADVRNFCATCPECHDVVTRQDIRWSKANGFYLPAFHFPHYWIYSISETDGQVIVQLNEFEPMIDETGECIWPEAHVIAWAAGMVSTAELTAVPASKRFEFRNGNKGDARLANLKVTS